MKVRFLLDENLSKQIKIATIRLNQAIDILCVGEQDAPAFGIDPDILLYLESASAVVDYG